MRFLFAANAIMQIQRYTDPEEFRADTDAFLLAKAASCSHMYSTTRGLTSEQVAQRRLWLARVHQNGVTCGAAVITTAAPMRLLAFTAIDDEAIDLVVQALAQDGMRPEALTGQVDTAYRIAARLGLRASERVRLGNHTLDTPPVIPTCAGRMRAATPDDYALVLAWEDAFIHECNLPYDKASLERMISDRLNAPMPLEWLWEVEGVPVAKALGRPSAPIARIGMVYTLPGQRGKGYAGALVGQLSAALQGQGCGRVFLATDMANPTSNGVYRRLGYRFIDEGTHLDLIAAIG